MGEGDCVKISLPSGRLHKYTLAGAFLQCMALPRRLLIPEDILPSALPPCTSPQLEVRALCVVQFFGSMLDRPLYQPQPDPNKPDFNKQTPFSPADAIRLNSRHIIPPYKHKELNTRLVRKTR